MSAASPTTRRQALRDRALPAAEIAEFARARAETLAAYGFDVNFAPVADVAFTPDSFMTGRTFGIDPAVVAEDVAAYLAGVAGTGVLHSRQAFSRAWPRFRRFPRGVAGARRRLRNLVGEDALPFRVAVEAGVPMVMLGHLVVPAWDELPASLSPAAVRVLRDDLGFSGVIVSDDLGMGALSAWTPLRSSIWPLTPATTSSSSSSRTSNQRR